MRKQSGLYPERAKAASQPNSDTSPVWAKVSLTTPEVAGATGGNAILVMTIAPNGA
jgi:hypothetical protein